MPLNFSCQNHTIRCSASYVSSIWPLLGHFSQCYPMGKLQTSCRSSKTHPIWTKLGMDILDTKPHLNFIVPSQSLIYGAPYYLIEQCPNSSYFYMRPAERFPSLDKLIKHYKANRSHLITNLSTVPSRMNSTVDLFTESNKTLSGLGTKGMCAITVSIIKKINLMCLFIIRLFGSNQVNRLLQINQINQLLENLERPRSLVQHL